MDGNLLAFIGKNFHGQNGNLYEFPFGSRNQLFVAKMVTLLDFHLAATPSMITLTIRCQMVTLILFPPSVLLVLVFFGSIAFTILCCCLKKWVAKAKPMPLKMNDPALLGKQSSRPQPNYAGPGHNNEAPI